MSKTVLKNKMVQFYNKNEQYFLQNAEDNKEFSDERKSILNFINENSRVLDVACGMAENAELVTTKAFYQGTEMSDAAIELAKKKFSNNKRISMGKGDAEQLPHKDDMFDVVMSTYALEHFTDPRKAIDEMVRVCKPGGKIVIIAPAWDNPFWVPPSMGHELDKPVVRMKFIVSQLVKLAALTLGIKKYYFDIIDQPAILSSEFVMDNDAVYIVRVREIRNYFKMKHQCRIIYLRKKMVSLKSLMRNSGSIKSGILKGLSMLLNIGYRYLDAGLYIVAEKQGKNEQ
jgi:ubiquinone/menaquinone biosynthesis C-methylase UbiE